MEIGKYKQAMSYLLNSNATLKTFTLNPDAKLTDNDPEMVISPQDILPKNPIPNMPSAPGIPDPRFRQLELADGGEVNYEDIIKNMIEDRTYTPTVNINRKEVGRIPEFEKARDKLRNQVPGFNEKYLANINFRKKQKMKEVLKSDPEKYSLEMAKKAERRRNRRLLGLEDKGSLTNQEKFLNFQQSLITRQLNDQVRNNPDIILKNKDLMDKLSTTISKQGDIIKIKPSLNDLKNRGIFEVEHQRDIYKKGKMKDFPYNRNLILGPHNRTGGFKNAAEKFIENNPNSSKIENILKKAEELKITLQPDVPEGTFKTKGIGYKQVSDPVGKFINIAKETVPELTNTPLGMEGYSKDIEMLKRGLQSNKKTIVNSLKESPELVNAARSAGIKCRRDIGGSIDIECLADNILKQKDLLNEGTELQKTSAFNKLKNFSKATGMGAIKVLGWVAVPLQINDTYEGYKEGLPLDEVALKGLLNAEGISQSFKEQRALSPKAREAKQILNPNTDVGMDSMGGMGYIETPSTMTEKEAEKIYKPEKEAYDKKLEEETIKRILDRGFDPYAKETEPNTGALEDLTDYSYMSAADGGRVKLADGGGPKFTRRGALGLLGAVAATPLVKKLMKGEKFATEAKALKAVKLIPKAAGMPEWFPSLVARIEKEGKDISIPVKNLEDMIVTKKLEIKVPGKKDPEIITMHKHPNGSIQIEADISGGSFDSPFELHYTPPKSDIDLATGKAINEPGDFNVLEQRPKKDWNGQMEIDYDYFSHEDAISDIERVEKIATGKRIHPKKVEQRTANRKLIENDPMEDVINRSPGPPDTPDWWEQ